VQIKYCHCHWCCLSRFLQPFPSQKRILLQNKLFIIYRSLSNYSIVLTLISVFLQVVYCNDKVLCHDGVINQGLCQKLCYNDTCECSMTGQTRITSCTQTCHWNNKDPCPKITCNGKNSCNQQCFSGECSMACHDTLECTQTCVSNECRKLVCSARKCYQVCSDCSMECAEGVSLCEQMCIGGLCEMTCHANKCKRMCNPNSECNYIGDSSSSRNLRGSFLIFVNAIMLWTLLKII